MHPTEEPTFAEILTAAIRNRGLSLERIRTRLDAAGVPVSIATLSYWQSGRSLPTRSRSYHTLVELEKILNLEPGHLTQHTHTADGRTRREAFEWQSVMPAADLATQIIGELGIDMQGQLTRVAVSDEVTVGPDRDEVMQETRTIWRVERQGLHRWAVVVEQDGPPPHLPRLEPLTGCRLGEVVEVPERNLMVAEMTAVQPLNRGDLFSASYRVSFDDTGEPSRRVSRAVTDTTRTLALHVSFHPDALPVRVFAATASGTDQEPQRLHELALVGNEAQWVLTDVRPGMYQIAWEWD